MAPPSEEPSAEDWTDELPRALEQEASHGGSVEAAVSLCCPEDSEGAEEKHIVLIHRQIFFCIIVFFAAQTNEFPSVDTKVKE